MENIPSGIEKERSPARNRIENVPRSGIEKAHSPVSGIE
jgi:hypothetical protein